MIKLIPVLLFSFLVKTTTAQIISADSLKILHDLFKDEELSKLIDSAENPHSIAKFSMGIGNKLFSVKNNSLNTSQSQVNKIYYIPSVSYYHKSGFGIGVMPYITNNNGCLKIYQTAITPSYDFDNKFISTGISYSYYVANNKSYNNNSIYQHELYSYIQYTKSYIKPIISLGYSAGNFKEINVFTVQFINTRTIRDSTKNNIKNFSVSAGVEHSFSADSIFSNKDAFMFTPQLMLLAGSEKYTSTHLNKAYDILLKRSRTIKSRTQTTNAGLALQSLALSLDATYSFGKFFISPNIYTDYFLPETTEKRLTTVFSIAFGVSF